MINTNPEYVGLMFYGNESKGSVAAPNIFLDLVCKLESVFKTHGIQTKCRGRISGHLGKNVAPRAGIFNPRLLECWIAKLNSIGDDSFCRFELFGPEWREGHHPLIYAAIDKFQSVLPFPCKVEDDYAGAGNCVTLAIHKEILKYTLVELELIAKQLGATISCFYGYINTYDAWDYGEDLLTCRGWLMDIRFRDIIEHRYKRGKLKMTELIPDLYKGNILSKEHFAEGSPHSLPNNNEFILETWSDQVFYLRFERDPQTNLEFRDSAIKYFNVAPKQSS